MSLARCYECGCLVNTDDGDSYFKLDENGDEIYQDDPICGNCQDGSY